MSHTEIERVAPVLTVSNRTMIPMRNFFVEKLGFTIGAEFGKGPIFVTLDRDGQSIMLECKPSLFGPKKAWAAYFWVTDIDAFHAELVSRGASLKGGIVDKEYGCKEIVARSPDGREIVFGQIIGD